MIDREHDDVIMVVKDLKRGSKVDYEPTILHYEDIFRKLDLGFVKVMPFAQLRREFTGFESRRKLANTYDYFMVDGRITGHVNGICGQPFQRARTTLQPVRMGDDSTKWKEAIERALKRTSFRQLCKGNLTSIPVATFRNSPKEVAENILCVVQQLKELFPGGWANIRGMHLKLDLRGTSSIPIYVSMMRPPSNTPNVIGLRERRFTKIRKAANKSFSRVIISKTGKVVKLSRSQLSARKNFNEAKKLLLLEKAKNADAAAAKKAKKAVIEKEVSA